MNRPHILPYAVLLCAVSFAGWTVWTRRPRSPADLFTSTPLPPVPPELIPVLHTPEDRAIFDTVQQRAISSLQPPKGLPRPSRYSPLSTFEDIQHVLYINLDSRPDRQKACTAEFARMRIPVTRVQAIACPLGVFGCSLSHIKCLEHAKRNNWSHVWINEDDLQFKVSREQLTTQVTEFLRLGLEWDVILFHAIVERAAPVVTRGRLSCLRIRSAWCTTSYLVRSEYYDVLLQNFYEGAVRLYRNPENRDHIDEFWKNLQARDRWYLLYPLVGQQRIGDSDIDQKPQKNLVDWTNNTLNSVVSTFRGKKIKQVAEGFESSSATLTRTILLAVLVPIGVIALIFWVLSRRRQEREELQNRQLRDIFLPSTMPSTGSAIDHEIHTRTERMSALKAQTAQTQKTQA